MDYPAAEVRYSDEVQLQGNLMDGNINFVIGGFASYEGYPNAREVCHSSTSLSIFGAPPPCSLNDSITLSQGVFGQATINLGIVSPTLEGLNLTAGYRQNWDYQKQKTRSVNRVTGACSSNEANADCYLIQSNEWAAPGWTFGLDYQIQPEQMVYVTASRAYSRGSFNSPNLPDSLRVVEPQFNTNLEGGIKSDWELGSTSLRTNAAVFFNGFDNVQENVTGAYTDAEGNRRISGVLLNAAKAHIYGAELTFQWIISDQFELSGAYSYSKAKYKEYESFNPITGEPESLTHRRYPFHADHSGNITVKYNLPVDQSWGDMSVAATATLMSDEVPLDDGSPVQPFNRSKLDLRADWTDMYGYPLDFSLSVTNVTNKRYSLIGFNLYQTLGILTTTGRNPA